MDIGLHCSVGACSQVDFLPFTCDCCRSVFCLEHRTYDAHECPLAGSKDRRVIDCPLCGNLLHWTTEQDVNAVWERHVQGGACAPKNGTTGKPRKAKKPRCGADGCREVLTASNQFQCTKCHQSVCLKHRFESDHDCENVRRSQQRQWGLPRRPNGAASAQQNAKKVAATVVSGTKSAVNSLVQNAKVRFWVAARVERRDCCIETQTHCAGGRGVGERRPDCVRRVSNVPQEVCVRLAAHRAREQGASRHSSDAIGSVHRSNSRTNSNHRVIQWRPRSVSAVPCRVPEPRRAHSARRERACGCDGSCGLCGRTPRRPYKRLGQVPSYVSGWTVRMSFLFPSPLVSERNTYRYDGKGKGNVHTNKHGQTLDFK